jgi:hypothetical protein
LVLVLGAVHAAWAGDMVQWHYDGTNWAAPYTTPGSFGHGVASYLASGVNNIAAIADPSGVAEWYAPLGAPGQYGNAGAVVADPTVVDVDSDDIRNGSRMFVTNANGIQEIRWVSPAWTLESVVSTGAGFTAAVIANDQDRVWGVQNGNVVRIERTGATTWETTSDLFAGPYVDLTVRSRESIGTSIVFALRDTGIDEIYNGAVVRSHEGLFSGATGISTWQDQDNLFVSTQTGLLHVRRDSGLSFTPAGVSVIDGTQGYLDVDAATFRSDTAFDLWAIAIPEPTTLVLLVLGAGAVAARRRR